MNMRARLGAEIVISIDNSGSMPIIKLVQRIFLEAIKVRAKLILFIPQEESPIIKFVADDRDYLVDISDGGGKRFLFPMTSRIKIISDLMISTRTLVQVGTVKLKRMPHMTVVVIPTQHGEAVTIFLR